MDINTVYELTSFIASKDRSGLFPKNKFNLVCPAALYEFNNKRYGNIKDILVTNSKSPRIAYSINQKVLDDLKVFQVTTQLSIDSNGQSIYPPDYWHTTSIRYREFINGPDCTPGTTSERDVDLIDNQDVTKRLNSVIVNPTPEFPICTFYSGYIQFYPITLGQVRFDYLRKPLTPVWGSTVVNNRDVYDPSSSVQLEVPDDCFNEIVALICQMLGINISDSEVFQFGQLKEKEGY